MLAVASYQFARSIGTDETLAHLATLSIVGSGVVWGQLITLDNDLAVAALFTAALNYGLRYARDGRAADLGYVAVAIGLLAGVKYYSLGYAAVAGLGAIAFAWSYRRPGILADRRGLPGRGSRPRRVLVCAERGRDGEPPVSVAALRCPALSPGTRPPGLVEYLPWQRSLGSRPPGTQGRVPGRWTVHRRRSALATHDLRGLAGWPVPGGGQRR